MIRNLFLIKCHQSSKAISLVCSNRVKTQLKMCLVVASKLPRPHNQPVDYSAKSLLQPHQRQLKIYSAR